jgi:hypothetical protein
MGNCMVEFRACGEDKILVTGDAVSLDISQAREAFPSVAKKLKHPGSTDRYSYRNGPYG